MFVRRQLFACAAVAALFASTLPALAAKFDSADADKDGTISAAEFGKAMKM